MANNLKGKTIFITGASRGIGREMALRFAKDGANLVIAAKSVTPHPKLPGTIFSVAEEVKAFGGDALAIPLDVRNEENITAAFHKAAEHFGGIDILINNASAIQLTDTAHTEMKRFDLMMQVNMRATFACSQAAVPYLAKAEDAHILTLSPPINLDPKWFAKHLAYTMSKYGMSMCTIGLAEELKPQNISVNSLWPRTTIATAAIEFNFPKELMQASRHPQIMADAAYYILTTPANKLSGQFLIDEDVLRTHGVNDFTPYAVNPNVALFPDLFL